MAHHTNLHVKVQEMTDCHKGTDPLREMSRLGDEKDPEQAAQKWIALAILHGVGSNAKEVSIRHHPDGSVTVRAEYREASLPAPAAEVGRRAMDMLRDLAHIEGDKGKAPLAFGWGNESLTLTVKAKRDGGSETLTLKFPE